MLKHLLWAAVLSAGLSSHAYAQNAQGQRVMLVDEAGRPIGASNILPTSSGAITAAGTSGGSAQNIQGINGGVAVAITATRQVSFVEANNAAVAANALLTPTARTPGATYTKINATAGCTAAGANLIVDGSSDGFSTYVTVATASIAAGSRNGGSAGSTITAPVNFTSYRAYVANGATANTCSVVSSFTVN